MAGWMRNVNSLGHDWLGLHYPKQRAKFARSASFEFAVFSNPELSPLH